MVTAAAAASPCCGHHRTRTLSRYGWGAMGGLRAALKPKP